METITSVNNEYIKQLSSLLKKEERIKQNKFLLEGIHLVKEALIHKMVEVILFNDESLINNLQINKDIKLIKISDKVVSKLSMTKTPQGIIAVCKMFNYDISEIYNAQRLLVLDAVNDPGNLGTLIRTAAALNYDGVIASLDTVDFYNDKALRATQGSIFKIKLFKQNLKQLIPLLKKHGFTCFGTALENGESIDNITKKDKLVITLGNEALGMSEEVKSLMDQNIYIPMSNKVESLNVAVAGAITMYQFKK